MTPGESLNEWYHYYGSNFYVFKERDDSVATSRGCGLSLTKGASVSLKAVPPKPLDINTTISRACSKNWCGMKG